MAAMKMVGTCLKSKPDKSLNIMLVAKDTICSDIQKILGVISTKGQKILGECIIRDTLVEGSGMSLKPEDTEISTYPPYKTGGQHLGLTHSGVLIFHHPTGLGVVSVNERSQHRNKEKALVMLEILLELETGQ